MGKETLKSILHRLVITGLVSLALTGCVKARLEIGVKPDGSGTMSVAIGMTQEALSFAGEDGEGVMERLSEEMSGDEDTEEVEIRRWREGNYEWFSTSTSFETLEDLNSRLTDIKEFGSVSVTRERGLVRDRFVLDGEINPLMGDEEAPGDLLIDPGGFFEFQVVVGLPGEVVKTNGAFMEGSTRMLWT
ncbi:MAG: LppM family (lipo)protein, partial [bacterium]